MLNLHLPTVLTAIDLIAVFVFAVSGALVASRKQMDVVGFMWLAVVTGVGGGTVRDLLLGLPVFWVREPAPVLVCLAAAVIAYFTAHLVQSRYRVLLWLDAAGLALVSVAGAAKALDAGTGPVVAIVMGVITATLGGVIRDILGQEPSIILKREIYVTAAVIGATMFVGLVGLGLGVTMAALLGGVTAFLVRGLAIRLGWSLPIYRPRAGRNVDALDKLR